VTLTGTNSAWDEFLLFAESVTIVRSGQVTHMRLGSLSRLTVKLLLQGFAGCYPGKENF
jgi:hypothetical protein